MIGNEYIHHWKDEGHRINCRCGDALGLVLQEILEPRDQWKLTLGYRSLEEPKAKDILVTNAKLVRREKMLLIEIFQQDN